MLLAKKINMEMLGIEPRAFCMQSRRSTTELHPHSLPAHNDVNTYFLLPFPWLLLATGTGLQCLMG